MKLDFEVPHIDDWAAASTWDQPVVEQVHAPPAIQQAPPPSTDDWGVNTWN